MYRLIFIYQAFHNEARIAYAQSTKAWPKSPTEQIQYKLVAQGGGNYLTGHRCPGEWNTVLAMKIITDFLVNDIEYTLSKQDFSYSLVHMPSIPASSIIMESVHFKK